MNNHCGKKKNRIHFSIIYTKYIKKHTLLPNQNNHFAIHLKKTLTFLYFQETMYYICRNIRKKEKKQYKNERSNHIREPEKEIS